MTTSPILLSPAWDAFIRDLEDFLAVLCNDASLFEPERLRERLNALDRLDCCLAGVDGELFRNDADVRIRGHAERIRIGLEAANMAVYDSIRSEILNGGSWHALLKWIQYLPGQSEPAPGLSYDYRDEILSGVFQLPEPQELRLYSLPEMVIYQPTPARHILRLLAASSVSETDVLVDLGSGLGHVAILVSMMTGMPSVGIEVEPAYVKSSRECAQSLGLQHAGFICADARAADLSSGTVFYLYSPFTGSILADVLDRLKNESKNRQIKICTLGPCAHEVAKQFWLEPLTLMDPEQITVFRTRL